MRTINFYQARDKMHREFLAGSDMPGPTRAVFRYLLEFTLYGGEGYGWVRHDACGVTTIALSTGFSEKTVKRAMAMLENNGLIKRVTRTRATGGRLSDEIRMEWDYLYAGAEGDSLTPNPQGDSLTPSGVAEGDSLTPSSISISKRTTSNPGEAGDGGGKLIQLRRNHG
jgi:hypothetical protein